MITLVSFLLGSTACPIPPIGPGGILDLSNILGKIDTTITNVSSDVDRWAATLGVLVSDLQGQGLTQAATYVRDTLQNGIARVGVEFRCNLDFTTNRVRQGLKALRDAITLAKGDATVSQEFDAFVCSATPDRISWREAPEAIALAGYDFKRENITAAAIDSDGNERDISFAINQASPYQLVVNLSSSGAAFPRACSKIKVRSRGSQISEIPCLVDCPPPPPPIVVPAKEVTLTNETQQCSDPTGFVGCRVDLDRGGACPDGFFRIEPFEVTRGASRGTTNCGDNGSGDWQNSPSPAGTYWQSSDKRDCAIHEHIGVGTWAFNNVFQTCRYVVRALRPEQITPVPGTPIGWCR